MGECTDIETDRTARWVAGPRAASAAGGVQGLDPRLVSLVAPASFEAEHYRTLRARLESRQEGKAPQILAVTSAAIGDGKTTTAINLAGALAQARDARVLLVDADLRRPSVGLQLGLSEERSAGLSDAILDAGRSLQSVVRRRPPLSLGILTAGSTPPAPYEVLKAPRLGALFDEARRLFDYIVVDTPPLIPVPDCRLIARWVDGLLMVVAAHRTPRKLVEEGLNLIEPSKIVGLVFNGDRRTPSGYYGYYHAYGRRPGRPRRGAPAAAPEPPG
ncbi:MAG TPA: CpsD/CapB family tyrosine-protein kinase [Candidatus Dormibacteraeota bacterium]|nr:CpsD/CapB family tyrosine-protein kinase [Candidatus Dormibacteraeota bacterium]